jgi:hypothetical protein
VLRCRPGTAKERILMWRSRISSAPRRAYGKIEQAGRRVALHPGHESPISKIWY